MALFKRSFVVLACLVVIGCGGSMSGEYSAAGSAADSGPEIDWSNWENMDLAGSVRAAPASMGALEAI